MATEALKSTTVTLADQTPPDFTTKRALRGSPLYSTMATIEVAVKDAASTYRMVRVPSGAYIFGVYMAWDDLTAAGSAANVGVYKTTADGGTAVDADFFGSAITLGSATDWTNITHEAGFYTIDDVEKPLWEAAGVSTDPSLWYDIVINTSTAITIAGTMSLRVDYTF